MKNSTVFSYELSDAIKYGTEEATVLYSIKFWLNRNKAKSHNIMDGFVWTYDTVESLCNYFPQFSAKQMRRIIASLKAHGAIITGDYSKNRFARKTWYTMPEFQCHIAPLSKDVDIEEPELQTQEPYCPNGQNDDFFPESAPRIAQMGSSRGAQMGNSATNEIAPDISTNKYCDFFSEDLNLPSDFISKSVSGLPKKYQNDALEIMKFWAETMGKKIDEKKDTKENKKRAKIICKQLQNGFTLQDCKNAVLGLSKSDWWMGRTASKIVPTNEIEHVFGKCFEAHMLNATLQNQVSKNPKVLDRNVAKYDQALVDKYSGFSGLIDGSNQQGVIDSQSVQQTTNLIGGYHDSVRF